MWRFMSPLHFFYLMCAQLRGYSVDLVISKLQFDKTIILSRNMSLCKNQFGHLLLSISQFCGAWYLSIYLSFRAPFVTLMIIPRCLKWDSYVENAFLSLKWTKYKWLFYLALNSFSSVWFVMLDYVDSFYYLCYHIISFCKLMLLMVWFISWKLNWFQVLFFWCFVFLCNSDICWTIIWYNTTIQCNVNL